MIIEIPVNEQNSHFLSLKKPRLMMLGVVALLHSLFIFLSLEQKVFWILSFSTFLFKKKFLTPTG